MKNKNDIIIASIILVTFIQGGLFIKIRYNNKEKSQPVMSEVKNEVKYTRDLDKSLSYLKKYSVTNRKRDGEEWIINVNFNGTKEEILFNLKSLEDFIIKSYNINFNNDVGEVNLELKSR